MNIYVSHLWEYFMHQYFDNFPLFYPVFFFWSSQTSWADWSSSFLISPTVWLSFCSAFWVSLFTLHSKILIKFFSVDSFIQLSHCQIVIVLICLLFLKKCSFLFFCCEGYFPHLFRAISYICLKFSSSFTVLISSGFFFCLFWSWFSLLEAYFWCFGSDYIGADWSPFGRGGAGLVNYMMWLGGDPSAHGKTLHWECSMCKNWASGFRDLFSGYSLFPPVRVLQFPALS